MGWMDWLKTAAGALHYDPTGGSGGIPGATPPIIGNSTGGSKPWWQTVLDVASGKGGLGKVIGTAGDVATGIEEGRAKDRSNQNDFNVVQDRNKIVANQNYEDALLGRAGLDLKQRQFSQDSQNNAYKNAIRSALGMNLQDVTLGGVPKDVPVIEFKGGLRPSAMGPQGRAAAALLNQKAMASLMNGETFDPLPAIRDFTPSDYKKGGVLDDILGGIGTVGKAGDIWKERGRADENQSWIDKLKEEIMKANQPKQPAPGTPDGVLMTGPDGKPVYANEGDNTTPFNPAKTGTVPLGSDPLDWLKIMQQAGG